MPTYQATIYASTEERFNVVSHALGFGLSVIATGLLLAKAEGTLEIISSLVYGCSMMILYAASTLYHNAKPGKLRNRLNIFDHAAIYVLIAGTYTPFCMITLHGDTGYTLLASVWIFALVGIVLKLFFTGRYDKLSTLMYIFMGWMVIFAIRPMLANLPAPGLWWLLAGGISYMVGAVFYSFPQRIRYNHAIFHVFVLVGSACHFVSVYGWVFSSYYL